MIKEVIWKWEYGVYVPFCPYCGEPAYERDICFDCCKEYKWVEGKYKPTEVHKGNYTAVQSTNNHVMIHCDGRMVMHSQCNKKKTEAELLKMIDCFIAFDKSGNIDDLFADESED